MLFTASLRLAYFTLPVTFPGIDQLPMQSQVSRFELPFLLVIDPNFIAKAHPSAYLTIKLKLPSQWLFGDG